MFGDKKYKLLKAEVVSNRLGGVNAKKLYRIQALRDIPRHGVKKGDIGGYVLSPDSLSHFGDCWIGGHAQVLESVFVTGDAYVGNNAILDGQREMKITVFDNARIIDNAAVTMWKMEGAPEGKSTATNIYGNFEASGNARILNLSKGCGNAKVYGDSLVKLATEVSGSSEVYGHANVFSESMILGNSKIYDYAIVNKKGIIIDSIISGHTKTEKDTTYTGKQLPPRQNTGILPFISPVSEVEIPEIITEYNEVIAEIDAYEKDIVKLIKYPVMTDSTDPHTLNMVLARKKTKRLFKNPESKEFSDAVADLEAKFTIAESNALKLAATKLTETEQKKMEKAKDLLAIAADEGSSENEKVISFKQAFKQLEGVVSVPEATVDAFRIKVGLKELEA